MPQFEKASGHKVATTWSGNATTPRSGWRPARPTISSSWPAPRSMSSSRRGKIVPGSRVDLAKSGVGVGVKAGAPKPDISSGDALKKHVLAAKSIGYSTGPSGDLCRRPVPAHGHRRRDQAEAQADADRRVRRHHHRQRRSRDRLPAGERADRTSPASTTSARCRPTSSTSPCSPAASIAGRSRRTRPRRWSSSSPRRPPPPAIKKHGMEPG